MGITNCTYLIRPWSRLYSDIRRPDAPVIYTGAFPILTAQLGWRSIYNTSIPFKYKAFALLYCLNNSYTNNDMVSDDFFYLIIVICLQTVLWFQVMYDNS